MKCSEETRSNSKVPGKLSAVGFFQNSHVPMLHRTSNQIRFRYLSELGIRPSSENGRRRPSIASNNKPVSGRRQVRFDDTISNVEVPPFPVPVATNELWYSAAELQEAAERNVVEQMFEDCQEEDLSASSSHQSSPTPSYQSIPDAYDATARRIQELSRLNRPLAIRNACLRPPGRPDLVYMMSLQHV
ncbi:expressed unknown protein [Seminavis robusta]|uniref:Uncharacterized protein n=1 Tax=Seminavis robusta TaxID=568900 RepID=A0A9N8I077_9STRA|nr:expressed unknown protein [Seminavis robusta]|eukprot:Sro2553_g331030.1 n/a (188) ;mRNA; r:2051-2614